MLLVSGAGDCTVRVWDSYSGQLVRAFEGHSEIVAQAVIGKTHVYSCAFDETVREWALDGSSERVLYEHSEDCLCIALSADESMIASGSDDCSVVLWSLSQNCLIKKLSME